MKDNTSRRSRRQHLTPEETAVTRKGCTASRSPREVAIELGCSMRTVEKYYRAQSGHVPRRYPSKAAKKPEPEQKPRSPAHRNLYVSNFEPT